MKTYSFEKLECWQNARQLAVWVFKNTLTFPAEEKYGIVSQMRRAAISIASNIAEGTSRISKRDQAHFSTVAYSSTIELLNDIIISHDLLFISDQLYTECREQIERQTRLISGLRKSQTIPKPPKP